MAKIQELNIFKLWRKKINFVFLFSVEHFDSETELLRKPGFAHFVKKSEPAAEGKEEKSYFYVISLKLQFANSSFAKFCRFLKT